MTPTQRIIQGDALEILKSLDSNIVQTCITSPPYFGLRDYGVDGQIGLEENPNDYISKLVVIFREVRRVLRNDGTLWLNLGDSYSAGKQGNSSYGDSTSGLNNSVRKGTKTGERNQTPTRSRKSQIGLNPKNLFGIPWRVALALQSDGWCLRQDIIWAKNAVMPESVKDRCTKSHEYIFLLSKNSKYFFDNIAIREDAVWDIDGNGTIKRKERQRDGLKSNPTEKVNGMRFTYPDGKHGYGQQSAKTISGFRNKRDVWTVNPYPYPGSHFATFPEELVEPMILAGSPAGGVVLDCFAGSGTTLAVAKRLNRKWLGIELNPEYIKLAEERIQRAGTPLF